LKIKDGHTKKSVTISFVFADFFGNNFVITYTNPKRIRRKANLSFLFNHTKVTGKLLRAEEKPKLNFFQKHVLSISLSATT
jgi:hypothetical protein